MIYSIEQKNKRCRLCFSPPRTVTPQQLLVDRKPRRRTRGPPARVGSYPLVRLRNTNQSAWRQNPDTAGQAPARPPLRPRAAPGLLQVLPGPAPPLASPGWPAARRQARAAAFQALLDFHRRHVAPRSRPLRSALGFTRGVTSKTWPTERVHQHIRAPPGTAATLRNTWAKCASSSPASTRPRP